MFQLVKAIRKFFTTNRAKGAAKPLKTARQSGISLKMIIDVDDCDQIKKVTFVERPLLSYRQQQ